ncbi:MAG: DEAD/DEAH box helicase [Isosphaeraceae bacterium]|nr:DEAD/DEAH box helicase [Isosphaeraceae bacterium]
MALTASLLNDVSKRVRDRGREYYLARAVTIHQGDANFVVATVRGTEGYEVTLNRTGRNLVAWCTCPHCANEYEACKHIWATVLAAEAQGFLGGNDGRPPRELVLAEDPDEEWDGDEFDDDPFGTVSTLVTSRNKPAVPKRDKPAPVPDWKRTLSSLRLSMERTAATQPTPLPAGSEIVYVVDVESTLAGDGLRLDVATRSRKMDGEWSKPKRQSIMASEIANLPDAADRQVLAVLAGAREPVNSYGYSYYDPSPSRYSLNAAIQETLLPVLCATGRAFLRRPAPADELLALRWDDGGPWEFWLAVVREENAQRYAVTGSLRRGEERLPLSAPHLLVAGGLVFWEDRVAPLRDFDAFYWVALLRREHQVLVPAKQKDELLAELLRLPNLPRLDLPEELQFEEARPAPRPLLKIKRDQSRYFSAREEPWLLGELSFDYDGQVIAARQPGRSLYEPARRRLVLRDVDAERAAAARLEQAGFRRKSAYSQGDSLELAPRNLPKTVRVLLQEGWRVEADGKLYRQAGDFNIEVTSGIDWFEVHGSASFGDQEVALPALLAALKRGENLVTLGDGTVGMVPEDWLKRYGLLADLGKVEGDHLRFGRVQVGLLDALLAERPEVQFDAQFERARDQLHRFQGIAPVDPPPAFQGELRGYQREGLGWLQFLQQFGFGGCLADDMGLGKTVQVLALLESRRELRRKPRKRDRPGPSLVVVPRSVVFNWKDEAARFTPQLRVLDHTGIGRAKPGPHFDEHDVILTTYGTLRRDIADLKDRRFDYAILDEAQAIKNANSQSAKAARLLDADYRLAMSGTPVENHLGELWSLFDFLNPGMLGHAAVLRLAEGGLRNPSEEGRMMLAKALRPFLLRRTKAQVAKDLPEKTEQTLYCDLEPAQRKLYDELREHYRTSLLARVARDGIKKAKIQILEALLRLRQAACHPALIDKKADGPSAKLDVLIPQLQEVFEEGHKTLVFSQFTSLLAIVKKRLDAENVPYEYLDGRTRDRASRVERFQNDPDCRLFLISLKAGGLGLNLTAADYVYLLDPWWNPAVESQAIDRAHRIGQTRPVFAYRLIARDTVEEKVLQLQEHKRALADAIITADNSVIRDLGREDLELLLS